jgi:hypothetical protein
MIHLSIHQFAIPNMSNSVAVSVSSSGDGARFGESWPSSASITNPCTSAQAVSAIE